MKPVTVFIMAVMIAYFASSAFGISTMAVGPSTYLDSVVSSTGVPLKTAVSGIAITTTFSNFGIDATPTLLGFDHTEPTPTTDLLPEVIINAFAPKQTNMASFHTLELENGALIVPATGVMRLGGEDYTPSTTAPPAMTTFTACTVNNSTVCMTFTLVAGGISKVPRIDWVVFVGGGIALGLMV